MNKPIALGIMAICIMLTMFLIGDIIQCILTKEIICNLK